MKKSLVLVASLLILFFSQSCKEVLPDRVLQSVLLDTVYSSSSSSSPQDKVVLFQEFTGASCVNCPEGHEYLKQIEELYKSKMSVIGIHSGVLAEPVKEGEEDLRIPASGSISDFFGVSARPSAVLDGKSFGGNKVLNRSEWKTNFESIMNNPVKLNVTTTSYYDNVYGKQILEITIEFLEDIEGDLNYGIAVTENDVRVSQKDGSEVVSNYQQNHVLRKMYTSALGNTLKKPSGNSNYPKGTVYKKRIELNELGSKWKQKDLYISTYVLDASTQEVFQASEVKFQP